MADALSRPSSAASALTVDVVQVPGLNPFGVFLPGSALPCQIHPVSTMQPLSSASSVDFSVLSSLQLSCPETTVLLSNPFLQVVWVCPMSSVLCDLSTGSPQPLVPVSLRLQVFDALHNLSHPGLCPTRRLVSRTFVWTGRLVGPRLFLCHQPPLRIVLEP